MATAALTPFISVDEYLHTVYRPDVDYVEGQIEERNLGEWDHATLQGALYACLRLHRLEWGIRVAPELRVRVAPQRFRVPDVCVMSVNKSKEQIVQQAPMLCLEVLSPEDRLPRVLARNADYFAMGVPEVWVFDPATRIARVCRPGGVVEERVDGCLSLDGTPITLDLAEVFSSLDED